jgi:hypothetical protein
MNVVSKLSRLILYSPWLLLVFLAAPIVVILNLRFHLEIPLVGRLLLVNNIVFAFLVGLRLVRYLSGMKRGIRYGADVPRSASVFDCQLPVARAREVLTGAGYTFAHGGGYGEKHDLGYLGATILYGGLFLLLATGSWDNVRRFGGTLLDSVGPATKLSRLESYRSLTMGPLPARPDSLPQMRILNQILPDSTYPKGATEIALIPEQGPPVTTVLMPTVPFRYGAYDIYMSKLVFEPQIVIRTKDERTLFDGFVRLDPLVQKRGDFSFYGLFQGPEVGGGGYYQPEKNLLMVVISRNGKKEVTEMRFQVDQQVVSGDYLLSCAKMGQWSEIHVVHRRHRGLLILGGIIALLGLALRVAVRSQRVWLDEAAGGCRVTALGPEAEQLLQRSNNSPMPLFAKR